MPPLFVDGVEIDNVVVDGVPQDNLVVDGVEVWARFTDVIDTMANDAIGTLQANHIMDSGHRWAEGANPPGTIQVHGSSSNGRSIYNHAATDGAAVAGSVINSQDYPDKFTITTRFDYIAGPLSVFLVLATKGDAQSAISVTFSDLSVSTDPSQVVLRLDGNIVYSVNVADPPGGTIPVIITVVVDGPTVTGSVSINGTVYNIPARTRINAPITAVGYNGSNGTLFGGTVSMGDFRVIKN